MSDELNRRDFLKKSAMAGVGIAVSSVALLRRTGGGILGHARRCFDRADRRQRLRVLILSPTAPATP